MLPHLLPITSVHITVATLVIGVCCVSGGDTAARHQAPSSVLSGATSGARRGLVGFAPASWLSDPARHTSVQPAEQVLSQCPPRTCLSPGQRRLVCQK